MVADAPAWDGTVYEGYDYGLIGENVDCLVLRVASYKGFSGTFPTAPVEPLEEAYYVFGELSGIVDRDKLALMVSTGGVLYLNGKEKGVLSRAEVEELLAVDGAKSYYSGRYGCSYLTSSQNDMEAVAWYLDGRGIEARARLAGLFGATQLCISDLNNLPAEAPEA